MHDYRTIISTLKTKKHLIHFDNYNIGVKNMCMIVMMSYGDNEYFLQLQIKNTYNYTFKNDTHTHTHMQMCVT